MSDHCVSYLAKYQRKLLHGFPLSTVYFKGQCNRELCIWWKMLLNVFNGLWQSVLGGIIMNAMRYCANNIDFNIKYMQCLRIWILLTKNNAYYSSYDFCTSIVCKKGNSQIESDCNGIRPNFCLIQFKTITTSQIEC